jgi:4-hydroxybenzoate polyprenyltransferase
MVMFRPQIYVTCGVLWAVAVEGSTVVLSGDAWRPTAATAARVTSVVLTLLFLRMVDEQKDLGYDRQHHPDRPLVTGAINVVELRAGMTLIAIGSAC